MNTDNSAKGDDVLNAIGEAVLKFDTRWLFLAALVFVGFFWLLLWLKKQRGMTVENATRLGLAVLQLYSAPVLFCLLVLTQPPAVDLVSNVQRQGAGLLACIFLFAGVLVQIKNLWDNPEVQPGATSPEAHLEKRKQEPPPHSPGK